MCPQTAKFPFSTKQIDAKLGCIPANISAAVEALGFPGLKEPELLDAYRYTISFANFVNLRVLKDFSFNGRAFIDLLDLEPYVAPSFEDWWNRVTENLRIGGFVLFAFKINGDSHIRTVVSVEPASETLETYDPSPLEPAREILMTKNELSNMWSSGKLNHDLLSIRRR